VTLHTDTSFKMADSDANTDINSTD